MEFLKKRASREELFGADDYAPSWGDHQLLRIERIKAIRAKELNVPTHTMKLAFEGRSYLEVYDRDGRRKRYRPEGIILEQSQAQDDVGMVEFDVAWVDPWGYHHTATQRFLDVMVKPVTEIAYWRILRSYRQSIGEHWVSNSRVE